MYGIFLFFFVDPKIRNYLYYNIWIVIGIQIWLDSF